MQLRPKDYVVIDDHLFFAVVSDRQEDGHALTFLRYIKDAQGIHKLNTEQAYQFIQGTYPELLFHSQYADIELHGIPVTSIENVIRPEQTVTKLLELVDPDDKQADALNMVRLIMSAGIRKEFLGITGSIMLNNHRANSDIDMLIYGRESFFKARNSIKHFIESGVLEELDDAMWEDTWQRRDCSLSFAEYCKHEKKKLNKCISGNSKVDISMIPSINEQLVENGPYKKLGLEKIKANIIDATFAFDFPARFYIDHDDIEEIVVYTATYTGQAESGETIEAVGYLEQGQDGKKRLVVGTSREAPGEYIRVIA